MDPRATYVPQPEAEKEPVHDRHEYRERQTGLNHLQPFASYQQKSSVRMMNTVHTNQVDNQSCSSTDETTMYDTVTSESTTAVHQLLWRCVADKLVARLHVTRQVDPVISLLVAKRTYRADVRDRKRC